MTKRSHKPKRVTRRVGKETPFAEAGTPMTSTPHNRRQRRALASWQRKQRTQDDR